jgi:hypothetical protein
MPEQSTPTRQRMIDAGANLVLGSHSHWFGPMQRIGADSLVFYSLGDLVFDWTHDERTQESAVADLTFVGGRLVQVDLHPTIIIDGQPNLLDPTGDGRARAGSDPSNVGTRSWAGRRGPTSPTRPCPSRGATLRGGQTVSAAWPPRKSGVPRPYATGSRPLRGRPDGRSTP